jgi:hypothetical protein
LKEDVMPLSRTLICSVSLALSLAIPGCMRSERYEGIALSDPRLADFSDLLEVDRKGLGIPPLPPAADVVADRGLRGPCDAILQVYSKYQQRGIGFRRVDGTLKWIREQVVVYGPRTYTTADGTFEEHLTFTCEQSRVADSKKYSLTIDYSGPDETLRRRADLKPGDVAPLLDQWLARP